MKILITGGLGSISQIAIERLTDHNLILFDNNENEMYNVKKKYPCLTYILGDIKNADSINKACKNVDIVLHTAALKHVKTGQDFPMESVNTNIIGTQNVIDACKNNDVKKLIYMSTDKSVEPTNVYGMTKHIAERMVLLEKDLNVSVIRSGNVYGSKGSVIPLFKELKRQGKKVPLTSMRMKRWFVSKKVIGDLIHNVMFNDVDKAIYIPLMINYKIVDIIKRMGLEYEIVGITKGEKLEEDLYWDYENYYQGVDCNLIFFKE
jgi:FlaA1/EpsC-like NDP-sugar epimerase